MTIAKKLWIGIGVLLLIFLLAGFVVEARLEAINEAHEYRFNFYPGRTEFYVDGKLMHRFTEGLPEEPMNLYVNA